MKNKIILGLITFVLLWAGCKKEPGLGGDASIQGSVYGYGYNSTFTVKLSEGYVPDKYVYIIYGNDVSYSQRVKTNYDGVFQFKYLYKGDYKIYTYSIDSAAIVNQEINPADSAVIVSVTITDKKQNYDTGVINVFN